MLRKRISEDIKIFNLEDLKIYLENQRKRYLSDLSFAEKIINDEVNNFEL